MAMKCIMYFAEMNSPMGPITFFSTERGICKVHFGGIETSESSLKAWAKKNFVISDFVLNEDKHQAVIEQFSQYFEGNRQSFDLPLDLAGTPFQQKVWAQLQSIAYGETHSYKEIAQAIYAPKAVRAVGGAVNKNPLPIIIPCHRVIGSNGSLVGYNGGLEKKEKLLIIENALEKIS